MIAIGRPWGTTASVPTESQVRSLLEKAYELGVRFFDTAPSYGLSEERLGGFLQSLSPEERSLVTAATKFGEYLDESGKGYTDYSLETLKRSLDTSLRYLGRIDILQIHKTSVELLNDPTINAFFDYARQLGIGAFGASISDPVVGELAMRDPRFDIVQLPYNQASLHLRPCVRMARVYGKRLIINRPFQMGRVMQQSSGNAAKNAFSFILAEDFDGIVLTGTSNLRHLQENVLAFEAAKEALLKG